MGYTTINSVRVYGKHFAYGKFGPTEMPFEVFKQNRNILCEVPITGKWLSKKFHKSFPDVVFKLSEMWKLDFDKTVQIARLLGIPYLSPKKTTDSQRRALRRSIRIVLD